MKPLVDTVKVCRPIGVVFTFITDVANVVLMSEHITDVMPCQTGLVVVGSRYLQTRVVHGRRYNETVAVTSLENNSRYTIRTRNLGIETDYDYRLVALSPSVTGIQLTKTARGKGWSKLLLPLSYHVLTRPEHDGRHLDVLKAAIEKYAPTTLASRPVVSGIQ
jgi:hypothetical protein